MTESVDATQPSPQEPATSSVQASIIRPLVAGNWKMNGLKTAFVEAMAVRDALQDSSKPQPEADVMICPPVTSLMVMAEFTKDTRLAVGGQDCHIAQNGAHTGDISAHMLKDAGASAVIVGHSERREDHGETDSLVATKTSAAHDAELIAIVCVGETAGQRQAGLTLDVIKRQLAGSLPDSVQAANTVVAYEPVWAIGTGLVPTLEDVADVHATIRSELESRFASQGTTMRLLYGGSVKPQNAPELLAVPNVNGALVGGASLKADDFLKIIEVYNPTT